MPLAEQLRRAGQPAEALEVLRQGLRHHPEHMPAQVVLARLHLEAGKRDLAVSILEEVVQADRQNVAAGTLLAGLLYDAGRLREAGQLLDTLAMVAPADPLVIGLRARARPAEAALTGYDGDPFDTEVWAERLAARGDYPRATRAWQRIYAANPTSARARSRVIELSRALEGFDTPTPVPGRGGRKRLPGYGETVAALLEDHEGPVPTGDDPLSAYARPFWES